MAEPNYESLGRYHAALEIFQGLSSRRQECLSELSVMLARSISSPTDMVVLTLDAARTEELVQELVRIDNEMMQVVDVINHHAEECGKAKVKVIDPVF
jgi:hypothetical protein